MHVRSVTYSVIILCGTEKNKTPRRTVISKRGHLTWSSEDMDSLAEDIDQASTPKKRRLSRRDSQEEMAVQIKNENRQGQKLKTEPPLWSHLMHKRF